MNRYFEMTETAVKATWRKLSDNSVHIPTQWLIEGDKQDGYTVSAVDNDLCGFDFLTIRTLYAAKRFIDQVNETGTTDMKKYCSVGSFAWANYPLPAKVN